MSTMSAELKKRYGGLGPYTYPQVKATLPGVGSSQKYADFAFAVFCHPDEFDKCGLSSVEVSRILSAGGKITRQEGYCGSLGSMSIDSGGFADGGGGD